MPGTGSCLDGYTWAFNQVHNGCATIAGNYGSCCTPNDVVESGGTEEMFGECHAQLVTSIETETCVESACMENGRVDSDWRLDPDCCGKADEVGCSAGYELSLDYTS